MDLQEKLNLWGILKELFSHYFLMYFSIILFLDVLLLIKKRAPPPLPKMAEVSAEEKVSLKDFLT